jgi:hypothetical protein
MELLKIGDKLYCKEISRWTDNVTYKFSTVQRITKTQAILSNGTKLINEPTKGHYDEVVGYTTYGDRWKKWYFETEEILLLAKKEREKQIINSWFEKRKFTNEEKRIIYLKFKELDLLEVVASVK